MDILKIDQAKHVINLDWDESNLSENNITTFLNNLDEELFTISKNDDIYFIVINFKRADYGYKLHTLIRDSHDVSIISKWEKIVLAIEQINKITICALNGRISEEAIQLALACDYRIFQTGSFFSFSAIKYGFLPGMAVFRIAKYIGLGRAKRMLIKGETIDAETALDWGLCDEVTPDLAKGVEQLLSGIEYNQIEAILMARRLLSSSYHDSYEDEIGDYLAAQIRCFNFLKKIKPNQ